MSGVFVSYRRSDSRHATGRLYDRLKSNFDDRDIFMDIDGIEPGMDFVEVLNDRVARCDIVLAIIGPNWLTAADDQGRRLDHPDDFVRIELEAALSRNIRVIPVLVDGAQMPRADDLPENLRTLARRQSVPVRHETFGADSELIITAVGKVLKPKAPTPPPQIHTPASIDDTNVAHLLVTAPQNNQMTLAPNIPYKAEKDLRAKTQTPSTEKALALIDLTIFKNGNDGILLTDKGAHHHHMGNRDFMTWQQIVDAGEITKPGMLEIMVGGRKWSISGGEGDHIVYVFNHIRDGLL